MNKTINQEEDMYRSMFYDLKIQEYAKLLKKEMKSEQPNQEAIAFYQHKVDKYQKTINQEEEMYRNMFHDLKIQEYGKLLKKEMKSEQPNKEAIAFYQHKVDKYQYFQNNKKQ